uniref:FZ domain-containing protein n=1 Tax=Strigamia maritima TaxID=126957 RepID=T1JHL5_STRMM
MKCLYSQGTQDRSGCGVHFNDFICSIYAPSCSNNSNFPIPPCRDLCKQVKSDCSRHQIPWPAALDCDKFPVEGGYCKCYNGSSWSTKDIKIESDSELTNQTVLPNFLNQTNQDDALAHINQYIPLIKVKCSSDFRLFLCSLYFPKCNGDDPPTPPCKSLCESAKNGCEPLIKKFGFSWPHEFNCDKFGSENCLKSAKGKKKYRIYSRISRLKTGQKPLKVDPLNFFFFFILFGSTYTRVNSRFKF